MTETDQAVEKMIRDAISARYPAHGFLGEETYAEDKKMVVGEGYTWIVDPIDVGDSVDSVSLRGGGRR